jgi:hypothetical protein
MASGIHIYSKRSHYFVAEYAYNKEETYMDRVCSNMSHYAIHRDVNL